ncbi:Uncharacterised protein [Helicobacter mustelae]|nr:Uncharacterised protein [Helicobacter mustelae]STP14152.1 Uncharacterised protein [Helicobacter mustelae]
MLLTLAGINAKEAALSSGDAQVLFGQKQSANNVTILNDTEMKQIQGKFW